jgi:hypothetical protein
VIFTERESLCLTSTLRVALATVRRGTSCFFFNATGHIFMDSDYSAFASSPDSRERERC